ncbi:MAG: hypothetical protein Q8Q94_03645, partial [bacterium]|nr:hypothetical protein [bacterium]
HLLKIENCKLKIILPLLFLLFFAAQNASAAVIIQRPLYVGLTNGLVGAWSFDGADMTSTAAIDRPGKNNHGTLTNGGKKVIATTIVSALRSGGIMS